MQLVVQRNRKVYVSGKKMIINFSKIINLLNSNIEIRLEDGLIMKSVIPGQENFLNIKADETNKLTFKNPNFSSKFRIKDKNSRIAKNVKNMVQDTLDSISYNLCKI